MSLEDPWGTYFQADEEIEYLETALAQGAYGSSYVYRQKLARLRELKNIKRQCAQMVGIPDGK